VRLIEEFFLAHAMNIKQACARTHAAARPAWTSPLSRERAASPNPRVRPG
jgi:hypothetical protein